jgi:hypothetical protein
MFTLKHITPLGNEALIESEDISYTPHAVPQPHPDRRLSHMTGAVWYKSVETGSLVPINDGTVYVMNGHGSTIAKYDLGGWAAPSEDDGVEVTTVKARAA